jgi:hypothetical protein
MCIYDKNMIIIYMIKIKINNDIKAFRYKIFLNFIFKGFNIIIYFYFFLTMFFIIII